MIISSHLYTSAGGARDKTLGLFDVLHQIKSLWAWVWILKSGFKKGFFFCWMFFNICIPCLSLTITNVFKRNKYKTKITYLTVICLQSQNSIENLCIYSMTTSFKQCHLSTDVLCLTSKCVCKLIYTTHLVFLN